MKRKENLNDIGVRMGTDKSSLLHNYLDYYQEFFPEPEKIKKVVELGLQRRSGKWKESAMPSVKMWLEFFPNAHVFGFDMQNLDSFERFTFFRGEQGRMKHHMEFAEKIGWDIDFVIDDASHRSPDQLLSLLFFWPRLKVGGIYIVEDTNAIVQQEYPEWMRTNNYFEDYVRAIGGDFTWIPSATAGKKSSLVIVKRYEN